MTTPTPGHDASLSLLTRIADDAMDPTYQLVSTGREQQRPPSAGRHALVVAGALLVLGALLTATVIQVREGAPEAERTRAALTDRVLSATSATNELAAQTQALQAEVTDLRDQALQGTESDRALRDQVTTAATTVGLTPVVGPGVQVVLDDGPPQPGDGAGPDLARVLDQDVQLAVNGLYGAGAEAVAINGRRLTSLTAVRGAGEAILVGYRPVSPPYVITALGDPVGLSARFAEGAAAGQLEDLSSVYGITFDITSEDALELPGASLPELRYAQRSTSP